MFVRFALASQGRSLLSILIIVLIQQFLAGILGGQAGLAAQLSEVLGPQGALWTVAAALILTYLGMSWLYYDTRVVEQRIVKALELHVMSRLIRHLVGLSVEFYDIHSEGDLVQALRADVARLREILRAYASLVLEGSMIVGLTIAAFWISPRLAFWVLVILPVILFPLIRVARGTLKRSYLVRREGYLLYDLVLEMLRGIRVIKVYRGEEREAQTIVERAQSYFDRLVEMVRVESLGRVILDSMAGLTIVAVVIAGGFQVLNGNLQWPALLAFLLAVRSLHGPLNNFNTNYLQIQRFGASLARINDLLDEVPSIQNLPNARGLSRRPETIEFKAVSFRRAGKWVLRDISFSACAGQTVGIAGPSGVGKTTLLNLIGRLFDPDQGAILFDGVDIREYRLEDVRAQVALVPQRPFLFATSVRENIRCGRPEAGEDEVEEAARAARVHEEILALEQGYDTCLGIGGRGLSEGQGQRINVARALLKRAAILLLDEATASLDSVTELHLQQALEEAAPDCITFLVAHRLSTLRSADSILVLDDERCVGWGSHDELLENCPIYREMWRAGVNETPQRMGEVSVKQLSGENA